MRKAIEELILIEAEERGETLSAEQLRDAANGVEYWVMSGIGESIDVALDLAVETQ